MQGKTRPAATADQALYAMDRMIATAQFGQQDIARRLGLNVTDLTCLGFLIEAAAAGESLVAGDLAERARLTTGAVTGVLNRLEKAGYVRRQPDPQDRRRVHVTMEESAQSRILEVYGPVYERLGALFADYGPDEIAVLADWFSRAKGLLQESLDEIRQGDSEPSRTEG
ncbi:MarR family transcriptional regulator [Streptomyces flavofungini]|uniref:MarR family transcriptional regulator n=1 Tax=Streptomyces flavofungini TaxID=68200 RepID=A0ABS0X7Y2_9ACTN|nr:MarR family transcriptional regulator [Streptomyces flavofungini]MBJ3809244.1 MarR family transcriptional regulator [Streptomyces flavofungini]GHC77133.1 putative HTH-type transcriptional regulator YcgE [Streptomyces flavofungini]